MENVLDMRCFNIPLELKREKIWSYSNLLSKHVHNILIRNTHVYDKPIEHNRKKCNVITNNLIFISDFLQAE